MKSFYKLLSIFLSLSFIILLAGCKKDYRNSCIYFELPDNPVTLDPQTASTDSDLIIVRNIYEGLLRKNQSGSIACGIAESYELNDLTYTFVLRQDALWSNGDRVTANDFVFGLRRAVDPKSECPFANQLFNIVNAEKINNGILSNENLGVTAINDYTLTITLIQPDDNFLDVLTTSVAMPCNENFFESSIGKYGLTAENTISNGSYELKKWNKDSFAMRLYRNETYTGTFVANNYAVFLTHNEKESSLSLLKDNNVDLAIIDSTLENEAKSAGLKTSSWENTCWVMTLSPKFSAQLRLSLCKLVGPQIYSQHMESGYSIADSLFPSALNAGDGLKNFGITDYNLEEGKNLFSKAILSLNDKKFPDSVKLYYYDNGSIKPIVTSIVGHWQNNLGAYINIEAASSPDLLLSQLTDQTYDMAVFPVNSKSQSVKDYLKNYGIDYKGESLQQIQSSLLSNNTIIPIAFQNSTIAYTSSLSSVIIESNNGYVDFSNIIKVE